MTPCAGDSPHPNARAPGPLRQCPMLAQGLLCLLVRPELVHTGTHRLTCARRVWTERIELPLVVVNVVRDRMTTDSRIDAREFNKPPKNVLRAYDNLKYSAQFRRLNYEPADFIKMEIRATVSQ